MRSGLIASRYASALAEFSAANGDEERTYDEVRRLIGLYRRDRSLRDVLFFARRRRRGEAGGAPRSVRTADERVARRFRAAGAAPSPGTLPLLHVLFVHGPLPTAAQHPRGAVETAAPVDDRFAGRVCRAAESRTHGEVRLAREVRPELIGGFVFRMDDVLIDASVAAQLKLLRRKLDANPIESYSL